MSSKKKTSPTASFVKAGLLLGLIVIIWLLADGLQNKGLPTNFSEIINTTRNNMASMQKILLDERQQDSIRQEYAGFWVGQPQEGVDTNRLKIADHLEINRNGIMWEVRDYQMHFPSGDSASFVHVIQSYLYPWSKKKNPTDPLIAQVRVLSQTIIAEGDTCYGPTVELMRTMLPRKANRGGFKVTLKKNQDDGSESSNQSGVKATTPDSKKDAADTAEVIEYEKRAIDWVVDLQKSKDGITRSRQRFVPYKGELSAFFPMGATRLKDNINLPVCQNAVTFNGFALAKATVALAKPSGIKRDSLHLSELIRDFYGPILWQAIQGSYATEILMATAPITLAFVVDAKGLVQDARLRKIAASQTNLERYIIDQVRQWRFPAATGSDQGNIPITYTYQY